MNLRLFSERKVLKFYLTGWSTLSDVTFQTKFKANFELKKLGKFKENKNHFEIDLKFLNKCSQAWTKFYKLARNQ